MSCAGEAPAPQGEKKLEPAKDAKGPSREPRNRASTFVHGRGCAGGAPAPQRGGEIGFDVRARQGLRGRGARATTGCAGEAPSTSSGQVRATTGCAGEAPFDKLRAGPSHRGRRRLNREGRQGSRQGREEIGFDVRVRTGAARAGRPRHKGEEKIEPQRTPRVPSRARRNRASTFGHGRGCAGGAPAPQRGRRNRLRRFGHDGAARARRPRHNGLRGRGPFEKLKAGPRHKQPPAKAPQTAKEGCNAKRSGQG